MCCVLLFVSDVKPPCYSTSAPALTGSTTFVEQWFCCPQCTNTSTLTFIALRQLRCPCLLNCLVLWIHNPACSVSLRRRLPFLQKRIIVTCERFSTQQLSEPNHVSNCEGPAWLRVVRLTSVCDSHPYLIRGLNFLSNSRCSCEVCKIKQSLWTMERFQKLSCHRTSLPMFTCSVEQRNLRSSQTWNRKKVWTHSEEFWRQFVWAYVLQVSSPIPVQMVWQN